MWGDVCRTAHRIECGVLGTVGRPVGGRATVFHFWWMGGHCLRCESHVLKPITFEGGGGGGVRRERFKG